MLFLRMNRYSHFITIGVVRRSAYAYLTRPERQPRIAELFCSVSTHGAPRFQSDYYR